jgi:hypothetical protein
MVQLRSPLLMRELSIGTLFTRSQRNMNKIIILIGGLLILGSTRESSAQTSLFERFRSKSKSESAPSNALALLSEDKVAAALKEALSQGVQHAVTQLGQPGGFLTNAAVRIPLPESLEKVEKPHRNGRRKRTSQVHRQSLVRIWGEPGGHGHRWLRDPEGNGWTV